MTQICDVYDLNLILKHEQWDHSMYEWPLQTPNADVFCLLKLQNIGFLARWLSRWPVSQGWMQRPCFAASCTSISATTATTQPSGRYTYRISFSRLVLRLLLSRFSENLTEIQTHLRSLVDKTHLWKCIRIVHCLISEFANLGVYAVGPSGRVTTIPNRLFTAKR